VPDTDLDFMILVDLIGVGY